MLTAPFAVVRMSVSPPNVCGAPLRTFVIRSMRLGIATSPVLGSSFRVYVKRPTRTSQTMLDDAVCVRWPNVIAGTDACRRCVASNGFTRVGTSGFTHASR